MMLPAPVDLTVRVLLPRFGSASAGERASICSAPPWPPGMGQAASNRVVVKSGPRQRCPGDLLSDSGGGQARTAKELPIRHDKSSGEPESAAPRHAVAHQWRDYPA